MSRLQAMQRFIAISTGEKLTLTPLSVDASFRSYYRLQNSHGQTYCLMDAPPDKETLNPFLGIAYALADAGFRVPKIYASDVADGFLLLEDFGDELLLNHLTASNVTDDYAQAMQIILDLQQAQHLKKLRLKDFDTDFICQEFSLFVDWYLKKHLRLDLTPAEAAMLQSVLDLIIANNQAQPKVFMHRDFHSRNLMRLTQGELGILDFQDAVFGPLSYDLVSLLKDCYIAWPLSKIEAWALQFYQQTELTVSADEFLTWFHITGLQRHLKVLGIFSRLNYRDQKSRYLNDLPRVLTYIHTVCEQYPVLKPLSIFLNQRGKSCVL